MASRFLVASFVAACALMILLPRSAAQERKADGEWVSLFNGKNLDGWTVKIAGHEPGDNHLDTFRVEDGVIKVSYDKYKQFDGKFGHLFYKDKFSHYDLRLQYRFVGKQAKGAPGWALRNSGVMFHSQSPQSMRKDQEFPVSIEFQFLGGLGKGKRPTGSMCSPGTNVVMDGKLITQHCVDSKSKSFHGDQWVSAELQVRGSGKVKHLINGEVVMEYEQPQLDPKDKDGAALIKAARGKLILEEGYLALQAESHPCEFRNIEVRVLKRAVPLRQAHAHNDYEHKRPLLDALEQGFCSVEADVFLVEDELLVGHTRLDLRRERTLEKLFLPHCDSACSPTAAASTAAVTCPSSPACPRCRTPVSRPRRPLRLSP